MTELDHPKQEEREAEGLPLTRTEIWECTSDACNGWMRKDMALDENPYCPICLEKMKPGFRFAPLLKRKIKPKFQKTIKFPH